MYDKNRPAEIQTQTHWNLIGSSMTASPSVIAQQYSSATFPSLRVHSLKAKFSAPLKKSLLF
jgi:hypothetical protein